MVDVWNQETSGLCYLGQLLPEGFVQHAANGRHLAMAYRGSDASVAPQFVRDDEVLDADADLFLRSSDLPRTIASGQTLVTAFLGGGHGGGGDGGREGAAAAAGAAAAGGGGGFKTMSSSRPSSSTSVLPKRPKWFAPELSKDYIYSNPSVCPRLAEWQAEIYASPEYERWFATGAGHPSGASLHPQAEESQDGANHENGRSPAEVLAEFTAAAGGDFPFDLADLEGSTLVRKKTEQSFLGG